MEKKGGRFGSMELDSWEDVAWDFQLVFFSLLVHCIFGFVRLLP